MLEQVLTTVRSPGLINFVICVGTGSFYPQVTRAYQFCDVCWNRFLRLSGHQGLFVMCVGTGSHWSPGLISDVYWNRFLLPTGHQGVFVMCVGTGSFDCQVTRDNL